MQTQRRGARTNAKGRRKERGKQRYKEKGKLRYKEKGKERRRKGDARSWDKEQRQPKEWAKDFPLPNQLPVKGQRINKRERERERDRQTIA